MPPLITPRAHASCSRLAAWDVSATQALEIVTRLRAMTMKGAQLGARDQQSGPPRKKAIRQSLDPHPSFTRASDRQKGFHADQRGDLLEDRVREATLVAVEARQGGGRVMPDAQVLQRLLDD